MCLGVPVRILSFKDDDMAVVELEGIRREVSIRLIENPMVGEYVLVHAGFAIEKIDETQARETLDILEKLSIYEE